MAKKKTKKPKTMMGKKAHMMRGMPRAMREAHEAMAGSYKSMPPKSSKKDV
jgi:hypothetical protein